ncbi:MAG: hypothetical protein JW798_00485, partial [Prolixibacteraceae bacterium]|nr:hypothetical protein [Prolixibacteraceae bacterium]
MFSINRKCFAQEELRFVNLAPENGLSNGNILCILQDYKGYMWIGTAEGLNRYDGLQFINYKRDRGDSSSLPGNYINTLTEDSENNLWIGVNNGICRYNRDFDCFERFTINDTNNHSFTHNVGSIFEDKNKKLWLGTNNGVFILDYNNKQFLPYLDSIVMGREITKISEDKLENIWISFKNGGILKYNPQSDSVEVYNTQHDRYRLNEDYIISFDIDCKNRIWLAYYSQGIS